MWRWQGLFLRVSQRRPAEYIDTTHMKLATYRDGSRDGQLVVVSRDLTMAHYATHAAHTLQHVLDDWNFISPQLQDLYVELNHGKGRHVFPFDPAMCMAPLPRAYQCVRAVAYASPSDGLAQAEWPVHGTAGLVAPDLMQLGSDALQGPSDEFVWTDEALQLDFEAGWAALTSDIPAGCTPARALAGVRLLALCNTWVLRSLADAERLAAVGSVQSRPAVAFSPVVVTPDEVGAAWSQGRLHLMLQTLWNGRRVGRTDAGAAMTLHMGQLLAQAAAHRPLRAGSVVCTGPVSSSREGDGVAAKWPDGYHSIQSKRAMEVLQTRQAATGFLASGDTVRMDMTGPDGLSVFGAIDQTVLTAPD